MSRRTGARLRIDSTVIVLGILLLLVIGLVAFGGGREHS